MPLAPLPLIGFIKAVGKPSTNLVSAPNAANKFFIASITTSKVPLVLNNEIATNIPTKYGIIFTAVSKPPFAPSIKASNTFIFLYTPPNTIKKKINKIIPVLNCSLNILIPTVLNVLTNQTSSAIIADMPAIQAIITG